MNLVPFAEEHFDTLSAWFERQSDVVLWIGPTLTFPLDRAQLQGLRADPQTRPCWMVEHAGGLVGHAQLRYDWPNGNARITGVAIAPSQRGRGLAAPMLACVMRAAFAHPEITRLELNVFTLNAIAIRLYDRLSFQREGVRRSCVPVGDERWDLLTMSMLRPEWEARPP